MDLASPLERMLLDWQVKSRFGFRCWGLVVFIQAFFGFPKGKNTIPVQGEKKPAGNTGVDISSSRCAPGCLCFLAAGSVVAAMPCRGRRHVQESARGQRLLA